MEKIVQALDAFTETVQKKNNAQIGFTWRNADDQLNYRVGLVAHEEAVLNAAMAAPSTSAEREELIKQYRLLRNYRLATANATPINPAATEYVKAKMTPVIDPANYHAWDRILNATAELREKLVKQF